MPFYGSPPALLSKPRPGSWTKSWAFLTHSMLYSLLTGGREREQNLWLVSFTQRVVGALSVQPGHLKNTKGQPDRVITGTHWMAIVISHHGSHILIKSFYCNVKHPAEKIEHFAYLNVEAGLTLIVFFLNPSFFFFFFPHTY